MRDQRPAVGDFHVYYEDYVAKVPDGDIAFTLERQFVDTRRLLESVTPEQEVYRYAEGKWSVREVVAHVRDTEAMFANRVLWIARQPEIEQPGMDQDLWTEVCGATDRPMVELIEDWAAVRNATVRLLKSLPDAAWDNRGRASGYEVSLRAIPWIIAGHARAHRAQLKKNYGLGA